MDTQHDGINTCLAIGHHYCNVLVIRCHHLEDVSISARVWRDGDDDEPVLIAEKTYRCGPFDSLRDRTIAGVELMDWALSMMLTLEPSA